MACSASTSFSISTNANPRDRPVSRSVMIRQLFTAPYRSNRLRTASSVALKSRLPTKIFFTNSPDDLKAGSSVRERRQDDAVVRKHSAGFAKAIQTRFDYTTARAPVGSGQNGQMWSTGQK